MDQEPAALNDLLSRLDRMGLLSQERPFGIQIFILYFGHAVFSPVEPDGMVVLEGSV